MDPFRAEVDGKVHEPIKLSNTTSKAPGCLEDLIFDAKPIEHVSGGQPRGASADNDHVSVEARSQITCVVVRRRAPHPKQARRERQHEPEVGAPGEECASAHGDHRRWSARGTVRVRPSQRMSTSPHLCNDLRVVGDAHCYARG